MLIPQEIIRRKRDGHTLSADEIAFMVRGISDGGLTEGQVAAFAMTVFLRGMSSEERVALTMGMASSGIRLDWRDLAARSVIDKHSTGGVGDKVSLMLAPIVAACGAFVPMISGRGLGHTGGTLDKLASIPGYNRSPTSPPSAASCARSAAPSSARPTIWPRRSSPLCHPRHHGQRRKHPADRQLDPVEEARGGPWRPGHGREDRFRRLRRQPADGARPRREPGRRRQWRRPADRGADHRHGQRAGSRCRQCHRGRGNRRLSA